MYRSDMWEESMIILMNWKLIPVTLKINVKHFSGFSRIEILLNILEISKYYLLASCFFVDGIHICLNAIAVHVRVRNFFFCLQSESFFYAPITNKPTFVFDNCPLTKKKKILDAQLRTTTRLVLNYSFLYVVFLRFTLWAVATGSILDILCTNIRVLGSCLKVVLRNVLTGLLTTFWGNVSRSSILLELLDFCKMSRYSYVQSSYSRE